MYFTWNSSRYVSFSWLFFQPFFTSVSNFICVKTIMTDSTHQIKSFFYLCADCPLKSNLTLDTIHNIAIWQSCYETRGRFRGMGTWLCPRTKFPNQREVTHNCVCQFAETIVHVFWASMLIERWHIRPRCINVNVQEPQSVVRILKGSPNRTLTESGFSAMQGASL